MASQSRMPSSGPFTAMGVQLALRFRWVSVLRRHGLTRHTSACFRSRAPGPVSGQLCGRQPVEDRSRRFRFPAAFRPPAFASWASCSRQGIGLSLRSAYRDTTEVSRTRTGFPRSARVRCGRVGCPLYPGGDGVPTAVGASSAVVCRLSAAGLLSSPALQSDPKSCPNEASARVHWRSPFRPSPRLWSPDGAGTLGLSLSFAPSHYWPRTSRRGPVTNTDQELRLRHWTEPPFDVLTHHVRPRVAALMGMSARAVNAGPAGCEDARNTGP